MDKKNYEYLRIIDDKTFIINGSSRRNSWKTFYPLCRDDKRQERSCGATATERPAKKRGQKCASAFLRDTHILNARVHETCELSFPQLVIGGPFDVLSPRLLSTKRQILRYLRDEKPSSVPFFARSRHLSRRPGS